ncbi:MAG: hypothetical protein ACREJN_15425 [Nitrospiraceae bacterium]
MRFRKSIFGGLAMLPLVGVLSLTGNSGVMAAPSEETLTATGTADDHPAAARRSQSKAQPLEAEAAELKPAASKIGRSEDTKGFRRGALTMAAQQTQAEAKEMQELSATPMRQAKALHGNVQPQYRPRGLWCRRRRPPSDLLTIRFFCGPGLGYFSWDSQQSPDTHSCTRDVHV